MVNEKLNTVQTERHFTPLRLLIITVVSIFMAEVFVVLFHPIIAPFNALEDALSAGLLLTVMLFPVLYLLMFRPSIRHITEARLTRNYGGRIKVESEPGNGSRFCFTLPIADEDDAGERGV
jgi:hypothetical protein